MRRRVWGPTMSRPVYVCVHGAQGPLAGESLIQWVIYKVGPTAPQAASALEGPVQTDIATPAKVYWRQGAQPTVRTTRAHTEGTWEPPTRYTLFPEPPSSVIQHAYPNQTHTGRKEGLPILSFTNSFFFWGGGGVIGGGGYLYLTCMLVYDQKIAY